MMSVFFVLFLTLSGLPDADRSRHYWKICQRPKVLTALWNEQKIYEIKICNTPTFRVVVSVVSFSVGYHPQLFKLNPFKVFNYQKSEGLKSE